MPRNAKKPRKTLYISLLSILAAVLLATAMAATASSDETGVNGEAETVPSGESSSYGELMTASYDKSGVFNAARITSPSDGSGVYEEYASYSVYVNYYRDSVGDANLLQVVEKGDARIGDTIEADLSAFAPAGYAAPGERSGAEIVQYGQNVVNVVYSPIKCLVTVNYYTAESPDSEPELFSTEALYAIQGSIIDIGGESRAPEGYSTLGLRSGVITAVADGDNVVNVVYYRETGDSMSFTVRYYKRGDDDPFETRDFTVEQAVLGDVAGLDLMIPAPEGYKYPGEVRGDGNSDDEDGENDGDGNGNGGGGGNDGGGENGGDGNGYDGADGAGDNGIDINAIINGSVDIVYYPNKYPVFARFNGAVERVIWLYDAETDSPAYTGEAFEEIDRLFNGWRLSENHAFWFEINSPPDIMQAGANYIDVSICHNYSEGNVILLRYYKDTLNEGNFITAFGWLPIGEDAYSLKTIHKDVFLINWFLPEGYLGEAIVPEVAVEGVNTVYIRYYKALLPSGPEIYVSPDGDDRNSGDIGYPLKSLLGARNKIRVIKEADGLPPGGITVYFRGGQYYMTESVTFAEEDSGAPDAPITYTAYPGETPLFTGGLYFNGSSLAPASGELAERIPAAARGNVRMLDLYENGFNSDDLVYDFDNSIPVIDIFAGDEAMHLARYPNKVPGLYAENPYHNYIYVEDGGEWVDGRKTGSVEHPVFRIPQQLVDRIAGWQNYDEVLLSGMLSIMWFHEYTQIYDFNQAERTIALEKNRSYDWDREPNFGKYYFENILEELDAPGEYYIDKQSGTLLLYPPGGIIMNDAVLKIPKMRSTMIETRGASWLTFLNMNLELCQGKGIEIWGGSHVTVDGCSIENISGYIGGVCVGRYVYGGWTLAEYYAEHGIFPPDEPSAEDNGLFHTVKNCHIRNCRYEGASINVGRISTRESGHFLFENNIVLNTMDGVSADGVGIRLLHNTVKHSLYGGMGLNGPDGEVAFNELCDVIADPGLNDWSGLGLHNGQIAWGLSVHDNYIHDIQRTPVRSWESYFGEVPFRIAMYVDGYAPGMELFRNVVRNVPAGIWMPYSQTFPSTYANNIVVDADLPVLATGLADLEWFKCITIEQFMSLDTSWKSEAVYKTGIYKTAWRDVYPEFYDLYEYLLNEKEDLTQPMSPVYNNICININTPRFNIDPKSYWGPMPPEDEVTPDPFYGRYENNRYFDYDPGFVDYAGGNIQLTREAAEALGVEWIDMSKIGAKRAEEPAPSPSPEPSPEPSPSPDPSPSPTPDPTPAPSPETPPYPEPSPEPSPEPTPPLEPSPDPSPTPSPSPTGGTRGAVRGSGGGAKEIQPLKPGTALPGGAPGGIEIEDVQTPLAGAASCANELYKFIIFAVNFLVSVLMIR